MRNYHVELLIELVAGAEVVMALEVEATGPETAMEDAITQAVTRFPELAAPTFTGILAWPAESIALERCAPARLLCARPEKSARA
jgi:hypothetical protein